jgi:hypothetical protein
MRWVVVACLFALALSGCAGAESQSSPRTESGEPQPASVVNTQATAGAADSGDTDDATAAVRGVFDGWVTAMTARDVQAAVQRFWDPQSASLWAQGDIRHHCSGYRVTSIEFKDGVATVNAVFRVEQQEWVDGRTDGKAQDEPYVARLRKNADGQWKLVRSTASLFIIDR